MFGSGKKLLGVFRSFQFQGTFGIEGFGVQGEMLELSITQGSGRSVCVVHATPAKGLTGIAISNTPGMYTLNAKPQTLNKNP